MDRNAPMTIPELGLLEFFGFSGKSPKKDDDWGYSHFSKSETSMTAMFDHFLAMAHVVVFAKMYGL